MLNGNLVYVVYRLYMKLRMCCLLYVEASGAYQSDKCVVVQITGKR